jgi:hypothetical protein
MAFGCGGQTYQKYLVFASACSVHEREETFLEAFNHVYLEVFLG